VYGRADTVPVCFKEVAAGAHTDVATA